MIWDVWNSEGLANYHCPRGKWRFALELAYPCDFLIEVPIERNPHSHSNYSGHACFYSCDDWSTIFGVHEVGDSLQLLVESGHLNPWGEKIRLFSTSSAIQDEEWGSNPANKFAFFRNKFWRIRRDIFCHNGYREIYEVYDGRIRYPIANATHNGRPVVGRISDISPPAVFFDWPLAMTPVPWREIVISSMPERMVNWIKEGF